MHAPENKAQSGRVGSWKNPKTCTARAPRMVLCTPTSHLLKQASHTTYTCSHVLRRAHTCLTPAHTCSHLLNHASHLLNQASHMLTHASHMRHIWTHILTRVHTCLTHASHLLTHAHTRSHMLRSVCLLSLACSLPPSRFFHYPLVLRSNSLHCSCSRSLCLALLCFVSAHNSSQYSGTH